MLRICRFILTYTAIRVIDTIPCGEEVLHDG